MKSIGIVLMLLITGSAYAELTIEYPATNQVRMSRNGALLLVTGQLDNGWIQHVYFKGQSVLMRIGEDKYKTQVFFENSPIKIAETDRDQDGCFDLIELYTIDGRAKTIYDLLHIGPDGRLTPFSDQELQSEQEKWSKLKDSPQKGARTQRTRLIAPKYRDIEAIGQ